MLWITQHQTIICLITLIFSCILSSIIFISKRKATRPKQTTAKITGINKGKDILQYSLSFIDNEKEINAITIPYEMNEKIKENDTVNISFFFSPIKKYVVKITNEEMKELARPWAKFPPIKLGIAMLAIGFAIALIIIQLAF